MMITLTAVAMTVKIHVVPVAKEKAAPGLRNSRSCTRSPTTSIVRPSPRVRTAQVFTSWSRTTDWAAISFSRAAAWASCAGVAVGGGGGACGGAGMSPAPSGGTVEVGDGGTVLVVVVLARWALAPIRSFAATVSRLGPLNLGERVPGGGEQVSREAGHQRHQGVGLEVVLGDRKDGRERDPQLIRGQARG